MAFPTSDLVGVYAEEYIHNKHPAKQHTFFLYYDSSIFNFECFISLQASPTYYTTKNLICKCRTVAGTHLVLPITETKEKMYHSN